MKAIVALAMLMASTPAVVIAAADQRSAANSERGERIEVTGRRICTRVERQGASRLAMRRICLSAEEWRERLGPDWRQHLAGSSNLEDDMDAIDNRAKAFSDVPTPATPK